MKHVRVRFAPSPTGALHIGGVRTALYNYLLARQTGGSFILRIEDTDQGRFVPGAEAYILEALSWLGLEPDESPVKPGPYGPYRQSERKPLYAEYAERLVAEGHAYYAFDTAEELEAARAATENFKYDHRSRLGLRNALSLPAAESQALIAAGAPYVVRLMVPAGETVAFSDSIRGRVEYPSDDIDDKVLMKSDGMPTYHLANVVDDYLMKISHVIRGEEWLPSTPTHVLLYRALGWASEMPVFAHLPLIMRPDGKGKLSKRDGAKFGIPVFPLDWESGGEPIKGFREWGFDPRAVLNFLALLGWSPASGQDMLSLSELTEFFDLGQVHKSGARFDFDKARWFNQQYLMQTEPAELAARALPLAQARGLEVDVEYLEKVCGLLRERLHFLPELFSEGAYFFADPEAQEVLAAEAKTIDKKIRKTWDTARQDAFQRLLIQIETTATENRFSASVLEALLNATETDLGLPKGEVFPFLRLALSGSMKGPDIAQLLEVLGPECSIHRIRILLSIFLIS